MKYLFILPGLFFASVAFGQVKGVVSDENGEPLAGANVVWMNTTSGTTTDLHGAFRLDRPKGAAKLIVRFIGFESDTLEVKHGNEQFNVVLRDNTVLDEVRVVGRKVGLTKLRNSVLNAETINEAELMKAACCNLGESFVTNPSVDVSYSDAATGAKQIRLLGLSGTYVQMLTENIPNFRGAASPYGLGYVPGPWMQSIQVSKGTSSVKNGYEALTGQINVEYKKPQTSDLLSLNLFMASNLRYEANADAAIRINQNLSTMILAHYENETQAHDSNDDGFIDYPKVKQYNLYNRWAYQKGKYLFQAGMKYIHESRTGGQMHEMPDPYKIGIGTNRYEGYAKNAWIIDPHRNMNIALILSGSIHEQNSFYGHKVYDLNQKNGYASLLFETEFTNVHALSAGLSFNYDGFDQHYRLVNSGGAALENSFPEESVSGAYAQYTFSPDSRWTVMAGLRGDYSSQYGFFVTPRAHVKFNPNDYIHFRISAGKGYRASRVLAENNYLLASSRKVVIDSPLEQEEAWNYGASISSYIPLFGKTLNLNAEYYYTDFIRQVVVDMDTDPHQVIFGNLAGRSYSQSFQVEATYPFFSGFTLTAAYRLTDAKTTYGGVLREKPLTSKYKGLLTASYQTPLGIWQFDTTLQLNGGGRMPMPYTTDSGTLSWNPRYGSFVQLSAQVTRYFRRWSVYIGGENLTNFRQPDPVIDAAHPWGRDFDATMIWGPVHGIKGYIGIRFNLERNE